MAELGITPRERRALFDALAATLALGDVEFDDDASADARVADGGLTDARCAVAPGARGDEPLARVCEVRQARERTRRKGGALGPVK